MSTTPFVKAERLQKLPPYLFAEIDKKKKAAIAAGRDVINLGVGDPDRPTPRPIIESLQKNVENPAFHQYALDQGAPELRQSIANFCSPGNFCSSDVIFVQMALSLVRRPKPVAKSSSAIALVMGVGGIRSNRSSGSYQCASLDRESFRAFGTCPSGNRGSRVQAIL